jgi:uncharacterized membrane protein
VQIIKTAAEYAAYILESAAMLVIIVGAIQAILLYLRKGFMKKIDLHVYMQSRLKLGLSLSLALGFLVGADIIKSAISPTWQELGHLGAIVAIRIVLNYFLTRDLKQLEGSIDQ